MMKKFLEIIVNVPHVAGIYHYHLPPELEKKVRKGHLVTVQFGRQIVQGVVVGFVDRPSVAETRPVIALVDQNAVLTMDQITLAQKLSFDCLAPLADCVSLMLPPGLDQQADLLYTPVNIAARKLTSTQQRIMNLMDQRGPMLGRQFDRAMKRVNWRSSMRSLVRQGLVIKQPVLPAPKVRPKSVRTVQLACDSNIAQNALPDLGRAGSQALGRRQKILRFLMQEPGPVEVSWVYAESDGNLQDLRYLEERNLVKFGESEVLRDPVERLDIQHYHTPDLTRDQEGVWKIVKQSIEESAAGNTVLPILLNGVTGSGKTEIYLRAVQETLSRNRRAIVLVPEIALTPQTVNRFAGRFPGRVGLIHSKLSPGERYDTWRRARQGEFGLIVGPRSALFSPLENIGLIVVDESHDDSYYQSEATPYYHAREVAVNYAEQIGAVCLLGSATPDVVSTYRAQSGQWQSLHLPSRILAHRDKVQTQLKRLKNQVALPISNYRPLEGQVDATDLPPVSVVDMRQELKKGNRSIFSQDLQLALQQAIDQKQQAILFLNRRGSATYVFCRDCGHDLKCPKCEIPLTFHQQRGVLLCHYCGYKRKMPDQCPKCGSRRIRHYGTGTQKVEAEVKTLFPTVQTLRWDYETTRKKGSHDLILKQFANQQADILIGTQMLAKGLDLPLVTLVGVILADVGLSMPDFRASERVFQVLTQVAGRAGRSPLGGQVILQTFQPEQYVIQSASRHDYDAFYQKELSFRRQANYPPFSKIVRLEYQHYDPAEVEQAATQMSKRISKWLVEDNRRSTRMVGPAPCFFSRVGGIYRWQIVLIGPDPALMLRGRKIDDWKIEVNPTNLL